MRERVFRLFLAVGLVAYLILLVRLIIFKYPDTMNEYILSSWSIEGVRRSIESANIIPFRTISASLFNPRLSVELPTLIYNLLAFMPFGFLLPWLWESARNTLWTLTAGFVVSLAFELIQLFTALGTGDVDDLILNATGAALGCIVFRVTTRFVARAA